MAIVSNEELAESFKDTLQFIDKNEYLKEAAKESTARTRVYPADFAEEVSAKKEGEVRVIEGRTLKEALKLHVEFPDKKIAVLSFANAFTPGGGVWGGCHAQEECCCRSSTLYRTLASNDAINNFYNYHKDRDRMASDTCIYSPDVVVCKDDSDGIPQRLKHEDFIKVDVITCAAPHLHWNSAISRDELLALHVKRAKNILRVCAYNGVDIFIGGAFGCGAFHNPAEVVAEAWRQALEEYREKFSLIAFVIYVSDYAPKRPGGEKNLQTFRSVFAKKESGLFREELKHSFKDTLSFFDEDSVLREAIASTNKRVVVYQPNFSLEAPAKKAGQVRVIEGRTLQTAMKLHAEYPDKKIAVLNFAASQRAGGLVWKGSTAQEESLCRSTTLYPSLKSDEAKKGFYQYHYENCDYRASDTCIYSPGVVICKDDNDDIPARLSPEQFVKIDVITCAAPHIFSNVAISYEDLLALHTSRAKQILRVCAYNDVDILITGAFGCGVFHNPPLTVAQAWQAALEEYAEKFDLVAFAIYSSHGESRNLRAFRSVFEGEEPVNMPSRKEMQEVFADTRKFFEEDSVLRSAIASTNENTKVYPPEFSQEVAAKKAGKIRVMKGRTLQAAIELRKEYPYARIAVLNFAASHHAGGGVWGGSRAQEESLCRSSTLYPSLITDIAQREFYSLDGGWQATDACIYSPDVMVCKDDTDQIPARLSRDKFVKVDVVTCAAPHIFKNVAISCDDLLAVHIKRAKNILRVCAANDVDVVVSGAFGCGAFHNPPEIVARAWKEALEDYREKFDLVAFALYSGKRESENMHTFRSVFSEE